MNNRTIQAYALDYNVYSAERLEIDTNTPTMSEYLLPNPNPNPYLQVPIMGHIAL